MSRGYYDMGEMRSEHTGVVTIAYGEPFLITERVFLAIESSCDKSFSLVMSLLICVLNRWSLHEV
jgi:hypothetical protein